MDWRPSPEGIRDNLYASAIWASLGLLVAAVLTVGVWLREMVSPPVLVVLAIVIYGFVMLAINQTKTLFRRKGEDAIRQKLAEIEERVWKLEKGDKIPYGELQPGKVIHPSPEGVLWKWHGEQGADGPFCPRHRERLFYNNWLKQVKTENFDDGFLGGNWWFTCPTDQEDFKFPEMISSFPR